jgi:hypothetical protein
MIWNLLVTIPMPPLVSVAWGQAWRIRGRHWAFYRGWGWAAGGGAVGYAISGAWNWAGLDAANALLAVILWWLSRRKRKRALRTLGAKSRALVAALARKAREAAKPRPVLRPVPGGARA